MRRILILSSFLMLFSNQIFAQGNGDGFTKTGLKLGLNYSKFIGNDTPGKSVSAIPGFALGGFFNYKFDRMFSVQPELYLTTKGSFVNTIGDINQNDLFIYIQLPIFMKITLFPENQSSVKPIFLLGPSLSIKTLAMNFTGMLEDINTTDWGIIFRAGIEYWKLSFEFSYDLSISNFDQSAEDIDLQNQTISFIVGFAF